MALKECSLNLNRSLQELEPHGTSDFPCAGYSEKYTDREEDTITWHWHEEMEIIYVANGSIKVQTPNHLYHLKEGEGIFINSNILHFAQAEPYCKIHSLVFHSLLVSGSEKTVFAEKYIAPLTHASGLESCVFGIKQLWEQTVIFHIIQAFSAMSQEEPGFEFVVREQLSYVCLSIYQHFEERITANAVPSSPDMLRVKKMMDYIHEHYSEEIALSQISKAADIGERECLRCFKRTIQTSPIQYLLKYRITHAAALLKSKPEASIAEVAMQCGFESPSNFSQLFKRYFKCSPKGYQKED